MWFFDFAYWVIFSFKFDLGNQRSLKLINALQNLAGVLVGIWGLSEIYGGNYISSLEPERRSLFRVLEAMAWLRTIPLMCMGVFTIVCGIAVCFELMRGRRQHIELRRE